MQEEYGCILVDALPDPNATKKSYKGLTGHWSKWGGARTGIATNQYGDDIAQEDWNCQSCGKTHPKDMSPYLYQYPENEYIRVCGVCYANKCIAMYERIRQDL